MKQYDQVVVGAGTSALTFLQGAVTGNNKLFNAAKTLVVGEGELWSKVNKASTVPHPNAKNAQKGEVYRPPEEMGQPLDLLGPIHKMGNPSGGLNNVTVNQYVQELSDLKKNVTELYVANKKELEFFQGKVEKVTRDGANGFKVSIGGHEPVTAKQVIIASGPGPAQTPQEATKGELKIEGEQFIQNKPRSYKEIVSGDEYLSTGPDAIKKRVLVHGSSPTSAWAVAQAIYLQAQAIVWLSRNSFDDANPAGRNSAVILYASERGLMTVGSVKKITVREGDLPENKPRLTVQFQGLANAKAPVIPLDPSFDGKDPRAINVLPADYQGALDFHQYVYCFGFNPMGPGGPAALLDSSIQDELQPVYDASKRFGSKPDETVIAYATKDKDLWVVGASVFREMGQAGLKGCQAKYKRIPDMLCMAGTPPEGIAAVKADIKAVTDMPSNGSALNWNLADRLELSTFLHNRYKNTTLVTPTRPDYTGNALKMADKIIERRKQTTFGWKKEVFNVVVVECALEVLGKVLDVPFKDQKFPWNEAGVEDMASFLRERFYPRLNATTSDKIASAIVKKRRDEQAEAHKKQPGAQVRWAIATFNAQVKQQAKSAANLDLDGNAIR